MAEEAESRSRLRRNRLLVLCSVLPALLAASCGCRKQNESSARLSSRVSLALREIETPSEPVWFVSMGTRRGEPGHAREVANRTVLRCFHYMEFLRRSREAVSGPLLAILERGQTLGARYRAAHVLCERGDRRALPFVRRMIAAKDPIEREFGWQLCGIAARDGRIGTGLEVAKILDLYAKEQDGNVTEMIEWVLGLVRATAAVPTLVARVKKNSPHSAVRALGVIGDPAAVPVLKASYSAHPSRQHLVSLAMIGTPEATRFVLERLGKGDYGAADAALHIDPASSLPALRRALAGDKGDLVRTEARIAIARLSSKDPPEALLELAEDGKENLSVRVAALVALRQDYDTAPFQKRLLELYTETKAPELRQQFLYLLQYSEAPGVTEAMILHTLENQRQRGRGSTRRTLLKQLNFRLELDCKTFEQLQGRLRERDAEKRARQLGAATPIVLVLGV